MKQKITIQLKMDCDKCRNKALRIAAEVEGVSSVSIEGDNKDRLVVIGVDVDTVYLGKLLKKKFRTVTILTVEELKPKSKQDKDKEEEEKKKKKEEEKKKKKEKEKEKEKEKPVCLCIVPYDPCSKCHSPKCHGQCNPCSKCQSFKCQGQCGPRPSYQCYDQCPPLYPSTRVVYDSYPDPCTIV